MSFALNRVEAAGFIQVQLENKNTGTRVSILPDYGAALHAFIVNTPGGDVNVIDHYSDQRTLEATLEERFKSCKLSPFACRIPGGQYEFQGRILTIDKRQEPGAAIHGLLYDKKFSISDEYCDHTQVSVTLKYNYNRDDAGYPFRYRCEARYTLFEDNVLEVQTTIINLDESVIPLADGWHPYFTLGDNIEDWMLRISSLSKIQFNHALIPTGKMVPSAEFSEEEPIAGRLIDDCYQLETRDNFAACTLFNPANGLSISFFPDKSYPYLIVFIPPDRKSIAIENLTAPPNCFNNKIGLIELAPGNSKTFAIHYKVNQE